MIKNHEYKVLVSHAEQLQVDGKIDEAIAKCVTAVEWAEANISPKKEM